MSLQPATVDAFRTFYEKALELEASTFLSKLSGRTIRVRWNPESGLSTAGPSHEETKSFSTTLRLFTLDRDRISFRSIAALGKTDPGLSNTWSSECGAVRDSLKTYLDSSPLMPLLPHEDGRPFANRDVFNTWVYGDLTHLQPAERERLRELLSTPLLNMNYVSDLQDTLATVLAHVFDLAGVNARELERHGTPGPNQPAPRLP